MNILHYYSLGENQNILHIPLSYEEHKEKALTIFIIRDNNTPDFYNDPCYPRLYIKETEYILIPVEELDEPQIRKKNDAYTACILQQKEDTKLAKKRIVEYLRQKYFTYCKQVNLEKNRFTNVLREWSTASEKEPECLYLFSFFQNARGIPVITHSAKNITGTQGDTILLPAAALPSVLQSHFANVNGILLIPGHMLETPVFCNTKDIRTPNKFFILLKKNDEKKVLSILFDYLNRLAENDGNQKDSALFWIALLEQYKKRKENL